MKRISVVLNVVAEEVVSLPTALASVKALADEIIIVDMTRDAALGGVSKRFKAKVFKHELVSYVEKARNFGIAKATGDWVFIMDPDEEIPGTLVRKLLSIAKKPEADYFRLPRKNIVFGKWLRHSRWWPDYNIRFFKKGMVSWNEIIHAVPISQGKGLDLPDKEEYALTHHHYQNVEQFLERLNRYTSVQAELLVKEGYQFNWPDLIKKPTAEFLSRYFAGEGYKDGVHGLALALLQAFSEATLYVKTWQLSGFTDNYPPIKKVTAEMKTNLKDINYWMADSLVKEGGGLGSRIKRRLKLP